MKPEHEFTLFIPGIRKLTQKQLDNLYEAGCDDALIGIRDGVACADFARQAASREEAIQSALDDMEKAGVTGSREPAKSSRPKVDV